MRKDDFEMLKIKLPKYPGIQGKDTYFNSAVLIPFIMKDGEYHLLFQKRAEHIRQGGEVCFPGGEHDPAQDTSYLDTAIRETVEELGIAREKITIEGMLDTIVAPMGTTIDPFIGILDIQNLNELRIDKNEVERVFLLPVSYFEQTEPEEYYMRLEIHPFYIDEHGQKQILLPVEELGLPQRYANPWGGREYRVFVYKTPEEVIWGLTARMIHDIIQKLKT